MPRGQRGALRAAVATTTAHTTRLQAVYADTAGSHLAAAGMALRLRKEGRVWVQTLKGRGDGLASRFEHEVVLPRAPGLPVLDASLHMATALAPALQLALRAGGSLQTVYRTDIQRLHRRLRYQGALIELALDRGHLIAGDRRWPVHEIEFELISGPALALPQLAAAWARRHALWWDVRTKSEMGFRLAQGLMSSPLAARPVAVAAGAAAAAAAAAAASPHEKSPSLSDLLAQTLSHAAEWAGGTASDAHGVTLLQQSLQALQVAVAPLDAQASAQLQQLTKSLHQDAAGAPALLRAVPFTALMLRLLQMHLQPQPARR